MSGRTRRRGRPPKGQETTWSWSTGSWGRDRVRVYEPRPGGALMIQYRTRENQVTREALSAWVEHPVYSKELAKKLATQISLHLSEARDNDQLRELLRRSKRRTLAELLSRYHEARAEGWSPRHHNEQMEWRGLFTGALGGHRWIHSITPHDVQIVVLEELGDQSASRRSKAQKYMKAAYTYAEKKLKWLTPEDNLSALDPIRVEKNVGEAYTTAELLALVPAMEVEDLRCGLLGEVMDYSARRLNALKRLTPEDIKVDRIRTDDAQEVEVWFLHFPAETDKADKAQRVPLSARGRRILARLLETPAVKATGLLFPTGDLQDPSAHTTYRGTRVPRRVIDHGDLVKMLRNAEARSGVQSQHGRAYHGIKRGVVTRELRNGVPVDIISALSGTLAGTLRENYVKIAGEPEELARFVLARDAAPSENMG